MVLTILPPQPTTPAPQLPYPYTVSTCTLVTSLTATPGQTLTIYPLPATPFTQVPTPTAPTHIPTITATEIDVILPQSQGIGGGGSVWATLVYLTTPILGTPTPWPSSTNYVVIPSSSPSTIVGAGGGSTTYTINPAPASSGWSSFSNAEKGGLIAGVVIAALLLIGLVWWCCGLQNRIWVARDAAEEGERVRGRRGGRGDGRAGTGMGYVYDLSGRR